MRLVIKKSMIGFSTNVTSRRERCKQETIKLLVLTNTARILWTFWSAYAKGSKKLKRLKNVDSSFVKKL